MNKVYQQKWNTKKPQLNKSGGTKDFDLYNRDFVNARCFYYETNYKGFYKQFLYHRILLLKASLYRVFSVSTDRVYH